MDYEKDFEESVESTSFGEIYCRHHPGEGKTLVFLHGFGATSMVWSRLMTSMPKRLNIYLIDLLGHGRSDAPKIDYTIDVQAQVLKELVAQIDKDCCLFGHSYGGWIAAHYASQQFACNGIILEDAAGLKRMFDEESEEDAEKRRGSMVKEAVAVHGNKEYVMRSIVNSNADMLDADALARINSPAVVVWGSKDRIVNIKFANDFAKGIKNSRLEIIAGAGHIPHYTHPKQVSEIIMKFVTR